MKKVLIISYYWVPSGGSGVQRWVKFCKYLRKYGWEPIIYTPLNPEFTTLDASFENDIPADMKVLKTEIWEPYKIYRSLSFGKTKTIQAGFISEDKKMGFKDKMSMWIRGNFLLPDPKCFWINSSQKYLSDYLRENPVDVIVSSGPPHSMHLIAKGIKKKFPNLPWISDFRDPWTSIFFYKDLKVNFISNYIQHRFEKSVLKSSDVVLVVSKGMEQEFQMHHPKRIEIISNGFDHLDSQNLESKLDEKFSISHIGQITEKQNPEGLWKVLSELCEEDKSFRNDLSIQLVGKVHHTVLESIQNHHLEANLNRQAYVKHQEALRYQRSSQVLLLTLVNEQGNKCILTGKLFEYLAAKRPILGIGPSDGDAAAIIQETESGQMLDFEDEKGIRELVLNYYSRYKSKNLNVDSKNIEPYSRDNLTARLAQVLDSVTN